MMGESSAQEKHQTDDAEVEKLRVQVQELNQRIENLQSGERVRDVATFASKLDAPNSLSLSRVQAESPAFEPKLCQSWLDWSARKGVLTDPPPPLLLQGRVRTM